ncbi:MAG: hypothetical protein RLZZ58_1680 [Pseudomonadota bacterium]
MSAADTSQSGGFSPRLMLALIGGGIVFFFLFWGLIAFGPNLANGNNGGGHALSRGAPGFAGIADLAERMGLESQIRRNVPTSDINFNADGDAIASLLILTPAPNTAPEKVAELIKAHGDQPVLVVLPKWTAMPDGKKPGWVMEGASYAASAAMLPEDYFGKAKMASGAVKNAQRRVAELAGRPVPLFVPAGAVRIEGEGIEPIANHPQGGAVLALSVSHDQLYVLAEPDLLNNLALADDERARGAVTLLDALAEETGAESLVWDVTLNGFGSSESLIRFAFTPPFAAITVALIAAGLLALWQSWFRFGPALRARRAIAMSKQALITNSADMIVQAGRELDAADGYAHHLRDVIAAGLHAPLGLRGTALDRWIDRFTPEGRETFSALGSRMVYARNKDEMLSLARALSDWRKDVLRDNR